MRWDDQTTVLHAQDFQLLSMVPYLEGVECLSKEGPYGARSLTSLV